MVLLEVPPWAVAYDGASSSCDTAFLSPFFVERERRVLRLRGVQIPVLMLFRLKLCIVLYMRPRFTLLLSVPL